MNSLTHPAFGGDSCRCLDCQARVEGGASVDTAGREYWEVKVEVKMHRPGGEKGGEVGIRRPLG